MSEEHPRAEGAAGTPDLDPQDDQDAAAAELEAEMRQELEDWDSNDLDLQAEEDSAEEPEEPQPRRETRASRRIESLIQERRRLEEELAQERATAESYRQSAPPSPAERDRQWAEEQEQTAAEIMEAAQLELEDAWRRRDHPTGRWQA
jgi:hypothetical protein